tara:strand:+ start:76 stop:948 length:873 start_codon:yes stop_codon:yes gene_type:complete
MKKTTFLITSLASLFIGSTLFSCSEGPKSSDKETTEIDSTAVTEDVEEMEEDDYFMLPSPIQIAAIFNRAGLGYESGLTNPVENISKYNTKTSKFLNFGVYSADLAYAVLNNQQQLSIDYLNAVKKLSEEIGMPGIFGSGRLIESFEKNVGNQDTVLQILTTIKRRTDEYLEENRESSKESIFFSAAWLEGMYLGANSSTDNERLTPRLVEQMTILKNIIKAIEIQKDETLEMDFMVDGLNEIRTTFNNFESVKKLENTDIEFGDVQLSDEEMKMLTEKINTLRTKVIEG